MTNIMFVSTMGVGFNGNYMTGGFAGWAFSKKNILVQFTKGNYSIEFVLSKV